MGTFYVDCTIRNIRREGSVAVTKILVDTGSEYTWIPEEDLKGIDVGKEKRGLSFIMANGEVVTRDVGYAVIQSEGFETVDEVVFSQKGDLTLLGSRTLEGFAAIVDARAKKLVAAGPLPVA